LEIWLEEFRKSILEWGTDIVLLALDLYPA